MSDEIPLELQVEIIKRVPVKSLLQFRSVSKQWKSLIDSPDFGDDYCALRSLPHRLLIRYFPIEEVELFKAYLKSIGSGPIKDFRKYKYVSVADDDTFEQHQIPTTTLPKSLYNFGKSIVVGCSNGLVCFYGSNHRDRSPKVVVWNPWIRKCVDVPVPNVLFGRYQTVFGFGVSLQTKDPKIVKIISLNSFDNKIDTSVGIPWRVEVCTLSSGTWKSPSGSIKNLPCRDSIRFCWGQVDLDGVIYWLAYEWIDVDGIFRYHNLIMSFDLSSEAFEEICLPDNLARRKYYELSIFRRMESIVVLENDESQTYYDVWLMGKGVTKSFTKLFTVMPRVSPDCIVHGFRKNGEPIVDHGSNALFAYGSYSEPIKDLGIVGASAMIMVALQSLELRAYNHWGRHTRMFSKAWLYRTSNAYIEPAVLVINMVGKHV